MTLMTTYDHPPEYFYSGPTPISRSRAIIDLDADIDIVTA